MSACRGPTKQLNDISRCLRIQDHIGTTVQSRLRHRPDATLTSFSYFLYSASFFALYASISLAASLRASLIFCTRSAGQRTELHRYSQAICARAPSLAPPSILLHGLTRTCQVSSGFPVDSSSGCCCLCAPPRPLRPLWPSKMHPSGPRQLTLPCLLNHLGSLLLSLEQRLDSLRVGGLIIRYQHSPYLDLERTIARDSKNERGRVASVYV